MRTFLLSIALFISAVCAAQVPSVTVENAKGEAFNTKTLLEEGTPMIVSFCLHRASHASVSSMQFMMLFLTGLRRLISAL